MSWNNPALVVGIDTLWETHQVLILIGKLANITGTVLSTKRRQVLEDPKSLSPKRTPNLPSPHTFHL